MDTEEKLKTNEEIDDIGDIDEDLEFDSSYLEDVRNKQQHITIRNNITSSIRRIIELIKYIQTGNVKIFIDKSTFTFMTDDQLNIIKQSFNSTIKYLNSANNYLSPTKKKHVKFDVGGEPTKGIMTNIMSLFKTNNSDSNLKVPKTSEIALETDTTSDGSSSSSSSSNTIITNNTQNRRRTEYLYLELKDLNNVLLYILYEINELKENADKYKEIEQFFPYDLFINKLNAAEFEITELRKKIIPEEIQANGILLDYAKLKEKIDDLKNQLPPELKTRISQGGRKRAYKRKTKKHPKRKARKSKRRR